MGNKHIWDNHLKVNLHNFGCKKIFVISRDDATRRRKDFESAWSYFDGFDYEFVDAVKTEDINVDEVKSDKFYDAAGSLSKTIYATFLSHQKVYKKICEQPEFQKDQSIPFLVMEDDARPTPALIDSIYDGEYKDILKKLSKYSWNVFFWGRQHKKIDTQERIDDSLAKPTLFVDWGAHAYALPSSFAYELIRRGTPIEMAADCFIDYVLHEKQGRYLSPYFSFVRQLVHINGQIILEPDDENFEYSSTTQRNYKVLGKRKGKYEWIHEDIQEWVDGVEDIELNGWLTKKITLSDTEDKIRYIGRGKGRQYTLQKKYLGDWKEQWRKVSKSNQPILEFLNTLDGKNKSLLDLGCGKGVLSELAIERGFKVTSVDNGNTPYKNNTKLDTKDLEGEWDYIVAAGFPPSQIPKKVKCKHFIFTTSRTDFANHNFPPTDKSKFTNFFNLTKGDLYISNKIYIRTNLKPLENWKKIDIKESLL